MVNNAPRNLTYQKYIYVFKIFLYDWLTTGSSSSFYSFFFEVIFPSYLQASSFDGLSQMYGPVDSFMTAFGQQLTSRLSLLRTIILLSVAATLLTLSALRVWGNKPLIDYYDSISHIKE